MKMIIDIPDNDYRHIKEYYEKNDIVEATYSYIYHGTPLDEVLDKIRDDMQKEKENIHFDLNEQKAKWVNSGIYDGLTWAQEIIDKYMKGDTE